LTIEKEREALFCGKKGKKKRAPAKREKGGEMPLEKRCNPKRKGKLNSLTRQEKTPL